MVTLKEILRAATNATETDKALIERAYLFAEKAHAGHTRYSGEPYLSHLTAIAKKLAEMGMGPRTISAGLLHDTIEDTEVTSDDIRTEFGEEILFLIEGVTKLSSVRYYGTDRHNESLRKLFVATSQDIRVLIIKLVDRLHNMQTLEHVPPEKQLRIARETLEIYVPVAHRLGMGRIRKELEDLAFPYVHPEEHARVAAMLATRAKKSEEILEKERKNLQKKLAEAGLKHFQTSYRVKGSYSLYHKLKRKDWNIDDVYDLMAMRIIVATVEECYQAMGVVHTLWRPLPKRIKDYINFPKPNGYQSIHTTVISGSGKIFEIQIRTEAMHQAAEYGIASHIAYKAVVVEGNGGGSWFANLVPSLFRPFAWRAQRQALEAPMRDLNAIKNIPPRQKIPHWIQQIGEMYTKEKATGQEFIDDMRKDFFENRIFVFTPNGDVVDLPVGATPIDFAYAIHSEIGDHIASSMVNNKMAQLDRELHNGDIVTIETKKSAQPSHKWLQAAKTSVAKRRIRAALAAREDAKKAAN